MMRLRVRLVHPDGTPIRWLKSAQDIEFSDVENQGGAIRFTLSARQAGYLEGPFNVEVGYTIGGGRFTRAPRTSLFRVEEDSGDDKSSRKFITYTGESEVWRAFPQHYAVAGASTKDGRRDFRTASGSPMSAGEILLEELSESAASGWAPHLSLGFTATHDSDGQAWQETDKAAFSLPVPSDQLQLVRSLIGQAMCEVESDGATVRVLRPGTTRDRTHVVLGGKGFARVPVRTSAKGFFTRLHVFYEGGGLWLPVPNADERFGTVDHLITLDGIMDHASAVRAAEAYLAEGTRKREESYDWTPYETGVVPLRDFKIGDTITAIARGGKRPRRVIGIVVQDRGGKCTARVIVGERIGTQTESFIRKLDSVTSGTAGGSGSAFTPGRPTPVPDPDAPIGLHIVSNRGTWADDGTARATVELAWSPVMRANDGSEVTIAEYEIAARAASGTLASLTTTPTPSVALETLPPGELRLVAVRARSTRGAWSPWSLELPVTPAVPASIVPKAPVLGGPTNTAVFLPDGRAVATIVQPWSAVTQSTDNTPVEIAEYEFSAGNETQRVTGLSGSVQVPSLKGVTVKVRARSTLGVWGDYSAPLTVTGATPAVVLPAPALTLVGGMGGVLASWNGLLAGAAPAAGFSRVELEIGTSATGPWTVQGAPWVAAGSQSVQAPVGEGRWARARAFDTLGRAGAYSAVVTATAAGVPLSAIPGLEGDLDEIRFTADGKNRIYVQQASPGVAVESRRNPTKNPSFEVGVSGWTGARATVVPDTTRARHGSGSAQVTVTDATSLQYLIQGAGTADRTPVTGGATVNMVASVWPETAGSFHFQLYEYDAAGTLITPVLNGSSTAAPAGAWTDIETAFTLRAAAASVRQVVLPSAALPMGTRYWVDAVGLPPQGDYFDGSTSPAPGKGYAWAGAVGASESIEYTSPFSPGDLWLKLDTAGTSVESIRVWSGVAWVPQVLYADSIIATGSITGVLVKAGTLSVDHVVPNFGTLLNLAANGALVQIGGQLNQAQADLSVTNQAVANADAKADAAMDAATTAQGTALGAVSANATTAALAQATAQALTAHKSIFQVTSDGGQFVTPDGSNALMLTPLGLAVQQNGIASMAIKGGTVIALDVITDALTAAGLRHEKSGNRTLVKTAS